MQLSVEQAIALVELLAAGVFDAVASRVVSEIYSEIRDEPA